MKQLLNVRADNLFKKCASLLTHNTHIYWYKTKLFEDKWKTSTRPNVSVANFFQPHKDSNAPFDREEEIIPTNVQPLGDVVCVKHNYEKALSPEKPPTPRKASANLTREDWYQIREELLKERCNRNALRSLNQIILNLKYVLGCICCPT